MLFEPIRVEFFRLFSKQLSRSSLNSYITCEMNPFQMFLETSKRPEVWQRQSRAVGCRTPSTAILSIVAGVADLGVIWRYPASAMDLFFQPLGGLHVRLGFDFPSLTMQVYSWWMSLWSYKIENCFPSECWVLNFFLSGRCRLTGFAILGRSNESVDRCGRAV